MCPTERGSGGIHCQIFFNQQQTACDVAVEVSAAVARRGGDNGELWSMCICDLRRKASQEGLEVDGSRVMLISSLEPEVDD